MSEASLPPDARGDALEILFSEQIDHYLERDYHHYLGQTASRFRGEFEELREAAVERARPYIDTDIPLLTVIPEGLIPLNDQLRLAGSRAFLEAGKMHNAEAFDDETDRPYVLLGVNTGEKYVDLSADQALEKLKARSMNGLRLVELVNLSVHAPVLWERYRGLYAGGTRYEEIEIPPTMIDLYRYGDGGLKVKRDPDHINDPEWTMPSYAGRVVIAA